MNKQFTASEVRDRADACRKWHEGPVIADMLDALADLLEAQEKAKPVATVEDQFGFPIMEWIGDAGEKCPVGTNLYTHSTPSDAERLAEALRHYCEQMETFQPQGELGAMHGAGMAFAYKDAAKTLRGLFAAHSAQAQPPAVSVTDEMVERARSAFVEADDGSTGITEAVRAALLAAQENPNGCLDKLRPEVREAMGALAALFSFGPESPDSEYFRTIRAELLRLAERNAALEAKATRDFEWNTELLAANKQAEAELAALKSRIAEAPIAAVRTVNDGMGGITRTYVCHESQSCIVLPSLDGKRVHLVVED